MLSITQRKNLLWQERVGLGILMRGFFLQRPGWGAGAFGGGLAKKLYVGPIDESVRGPKKLFLETNYYS